MNITLNVAASKSYVRPQGPVGGSTAAEASEEAPKTTESEEIKRLRYTHQKTAFDIDIDALESHPWRNKNVDISSYFNYGFNEATLRVRHLL